MSNSYINDFVFNSAAQRLKTHYSLEGEKWCDGKIYPFPVELEPCFESFEALKALDEIPIVSTKEKPHLNKFGELSVIKAWFSSKDDYKILALDETLKQQTVTSHPVCFEIIGNSDSIAIHFIVETVDAKSVMNSLKARYQNSEFQLLEYDPMSRMINDVNRDMPVNPLICNFYNFYPAPPYFRTLSVPVEGTPAPLIAMFNALNMLNNKNEFGFLQIIYKATNPDNGWLSNIENLIYSEINTQGYKRALFQQDEGNNGFTSFGRTKNIGIVKADPSRPFYAVCLRFGFFCDPNKLKEIEKSFFLYIHSYRYGNNNLKSKSLEDYLKVSKNEKVLYDMFVSRNSYSHGMLLNTLELAGLMHITPEVFKTTDYMLDYKKGFPAPDIMKSEGNELGINCFCGIKTPVKMALEARFRHIICQGLTGSGKTTFMNNMILDDIEKGYGILFIDPVGEASDYLLNNIPESRFNDVIFIDPTIEGFIPQLNICKLDNYNNAGRVIDYYLNSFKSLFEQWGDSLEYTLRECLAALILTPGLCLADIEILISYSKEGNSLRNEVVKYIDNPASVNFWKNEIMKYAFRTIAPVKNKISKLLRSNVLCTRLFAQRENLIDFKKVMDENKILIMNFPSGHLGPETATTFSSFMLALFHKAVISRYSSPVEKRAPFFVYLDEFQKFNTGDIEPLMADARRYRVGLHVFHHMRGQLKEGVETALKNANTVVTFNLDQENASKMSKEMLCLVEPSEIVTLKKGEAIMRCDGHIVNFKTNPPLRTSDHDKKDKIIKNSVERYYFPANKVQTPTFLRPGFATRNEIKNNRNISTKRVFDTFDGKGD